MTYDFSSTSILIVEDNAPMAFIVAGILKNFGVANILEAKDGYAGYRLLCEKNPDIVICDWLMRPGDGIEFTRNVRQNPKTPNPYVPIILMTGFSERHRVMHARDAGVTEFLVKPFSARDLYRRLHQIIERPRQFVMSDEFTGPDRRRQNKDGFKGPDRRAGKADAKDRAVSARDTFEIDL